MIRLLDSPDDVIALEVSNKISGADLDAVMDRLDAVMASHAKVHVFMETREIDGIEVTCMDVAMPVVMARASDFGLTGLESAAELDRDGHHPVVTPVPMAFRCSETGSVSESETRWRE